MKKSVKTYLINPDITLMSLVELGANYTQVKDGKTVLLMKSAKHAQENSEQENEKMTEKEKLEARERKLKAELKVVEDLISQKNSDTEGEVADGEKPGDDGDTETNTDGETNTDTENENAGDDDGQVDLAERVKELEAEVKTKDEELAGLTADNKKLQDVVEAYYVAVAPEETEGDK